MNWPRLIVIADGLVITKGAGGLGSRVELFAAIRRDARVEGCSVRELADRYHVHRRAVRQALASAVPPPRKTPARNSPQLAPFQARAAGTFTPAHEAFWAAAREALGDGPGTRALVEVLLLHRHLCHADVLASITAALDVGSIRPDVVAAGARKAAQRRGIQPPPVQALSGQQVISLTERRQAGLPADGRPLPSVAVYDNLLGKASSRPHAAGSPSKPRSPRSTPPPGYCGCPPSAAGSKRSPPQPSASSCPTPASSPNW